MKVHMNLVLSSMTLLLFLQCEEFTSRFQKTENDLHVLEISVQSYYLSNQALPNPQSWRQEIKKYLEDQRIPTDHWGNEYEYVKVDPCQNGDEGCVPFYFYSKGKDGISKMNGMDKDDICTCKLEKYIADGKEEYRLDYTRPNNWAFFISIGFIIIIILIIYLIISSLIKKIIHRRK